MDLTDVRSTLFIPRRGIHCLGRLICRSVLPSSWSESIAEELSWEDNDNKPPRRTHAIAWWRHPKTTTVDAGYHSKSRSDDPDQPTRTTISREGKKNSYNFARIPPRPLTIFESEPEGISFPLEIQNLIRWSARAILAAFEIRLKLRPCRDLGKRGRFVGSSVPAPEMMRELLEAKNVVLDHPPDISNKNPSGNPAGMRNRTRERPEVDASLIKMRQCSWISVFFCARLMFLLGRT